MRTPPKIRALRDILTNQETSRCVENPAALPAYPEDYYAEQQPIGSGCYRVSTRYNEEDESC